MNNSMSLEIKFYDQYEASFQLDTNSQENTRDRVELLLASR